MTKRITFNAEDEQNINYHKASSVAGYRELGPWIRMVLDREVKRVAEQQGREPVRGEKAWDLS